MSITKALCLSALLTAGAIGCHRADHDRNEAPGSPRVIEGADDSPETRRPTPEVPGTDSRFKPSSETGTAGAAGTQQSTEAYNAQAANSANGGNAAPDTTGAGPMGQVHNDDATPMGTVDAGAGSGASKGSGKGKSGSGSGSSAGGGW